MVYDPSDPEKGSIGHCLLNDSIIKMIFYNNVIYAGLADGNVAVFTELNNPRKNLRPEVVIKVGQEKITSILGSKDSIYAACGNAVVTIDAKTHTIEVIQAVYKSVYKIFYVNSSACESKFSSLRKFLIWK